MSAKTVSCVCGFTTGDRVTMILGGSAPDRLYGTVKDWQAGRPPTRCGHIVSWDDNPYIATALPNPNVQKYTRPS